MTHATWVLGLQTGKIGPLASVLLDWKLRFGYIRKNKDQPLWKIYGGKSDKVPVYEQHQPSNLIDLTQQLPTVQVIKAQIGFWKDRDLNNITNSKILLKKILI